MAEMFILITVSEVSIHDCLPTHRLGFVGAQPVMVGAYGRGLIISWQPGNKEKRKGLCLKTSSGPHTQWTDFLPLFSEDPITLPSPLQRTVQDLIHGAPRDI